MPTRRNPIKKMMEEDRKWGMIHRDRKKYHRESPNHHEYDEEIELTLEEREKEN